MRQFFKSYHSYVGPVVTRNVLPRFVLSLTCPSAATESVFSGAALLDAPRRNRMSPEVFEKLTVVQGS